jgi:hypothetical protein
MDELKQQLVASASRSVILEGSVEYTKECCNSKQWAYPEEYYILTGYPYSKVISRITINKNDTSPRLVLEYQQRS